MIDTLALANYQSTMTLGLSVASVLANVVVALFVFWIKTQIQKIDVLQDKIKEQTQQCVDKGLAEITKRLENGEIEFKRQNERDHSLELKTLQAIESLHREIIEKTATKKELLQLGERVRNLDIQIATLRGAA